MKDIRSTAHCVAVQDGFRSSHDVIMHGASDEAHRRFRVFGNGATSPGRSSQLL